VVLLLTAFQNTVRINELIRKRLKPLNEGAAIITAGDMNFRIKSEGIDEFSLLGQTINHMTEAIQTKIHEEQRLAELLRIAAAVFETNDGILITDASGNILRANSAFQKMSGYSEEEILHKNPRILNSGRETHEFYDAMWQQLLSKGFWSGEMWDKRKDGTIYPKWLTITAIKNDAGETTQYVGIFSNIADRQQVELEINRLVFYDVLTGLPNRRLLMDRMRLAFSTSVRSQQYGAVLFLDMDKFKLLNDTLGHDYGDLMLIEVARRIEMCVREIDTVSRIGGDEFVVLLEEMGEHDENASRMAAMIAEKIRAALAQPYHLKDNEHHSSPSIGVCLYLSNDESPDTVLKHADMAMYQVKESGRNAVKFFDPKMQLAVEERAAIETDLRTASDDQQFELLYQIQVDGEHNPVGAEALLRWNHPTRGTVLPQDFISIAEESSLVIDIGGWVLNSVCHQLAVWSKEIRTSHLILSVNVSTRQFKQLNFVAQISSLITLHGIDPSHLKLELTESLVFGDITNMIAKMHELMAIGVKLSMDDFGKGYYSSLTYLKQLPLDQLKIDQSFVRNMNTDSNDALMVKTIIDLAKNFHLNVIAEGVETEAQLSLLKELGCLNYQGYLFGKPMPADQLDASLQ
jgi:diguanylate cyclase (GGDEF)-like protein/PAS domain S-box-containing protein